MCALINLRLVAKHPDIATGGLIGCVLHCFGCTIHILHYFVFYFQSSELHSIQLQLKKWFHFHLLFEANRIQPIVYGIQGLKRFKLICGR